MNGTHAASSPPGHETAVARSSFFSVNGLRYHLLQWGRPKTRRPVLLVHGLGSNARVWELVAELLQPTGLYLVAPDLRGHGLSDKPTSGYGFRTVVADLKDLVGRLDLAHPLIVGHSWGALQTLEYAARNRRGPASPRGIVLVDGGIVQFSEIPGATWERVRSFLMPPRWDGMQVTDLIRRLRDPLRAWQPDDRALETILANYEVSSQGTLRPHMPHERYMNIVHRIWQFKTYKRFERLRCPVLMLPVRPREGAPRWEMAYVALKELGIQRAQAAIAHLTVSWMEHAVHDIPLQNPAKLSQQILDFERSLPG